MSNKRIRAGRTLLQLRQHIRKHITDRRNRADQTHSYGEWDYKTDLPNYKSVFHHGLMGCNSGKHSTIRLGAFGMKNGDQKLGKVRYMIFGIVLILLAALWLFRQILH